jgi:molybdopterin molybdotransferase
LLAALAGQRGSQPNFAMARLTSDLRLKPGLTRFLPAFLQSSQPIPTATPVRTQGSGDLAANARANCYIVVPDDCELLAADQMVRILLR